MITVTMSVSIDADRPRVWGALTRPAELIAWSPDRTEALAVDADYPKPGGLARWRYRLHGVPMPMTESPVEVIPSERLRSELRLSLVRFDQTWTLTRDPDDPAHRTRVSLKLISPNAIPMVGGELDRFRVRELAQQLVDENLRAVRTWCEQDH